MSPSQFREKTRKEAHTNGFSSVQKLQAKTERGKYILLRAVKVHSKVTFQSRSTEHVRLLLNQVWRTHLAIFDISHQKRVRTLESFFAPNRSQSESEKNDTKEEQCIKQEETDEDQRKLKKSRTFQKIWL